MSSSLPRLPIGIDLGTTYSLVAWVDSQGRPQTITNAEGDLTTPSVVFFDRDVAIVGKEAVKAAEFEPDRIAQFAKRDMGSPVYHKPIRGEQLPPEVVQSLILKKLKQDAELRLGPIRDAVITVPAYFNEPRRKATQDAGRLAGLNVIDIINEPTAAAIAYGIERGFLSSDGTSSGRETVLVYDLGGGTFDVTLMDLHGQQFDTIGTAGDVYLGGIDWDQRIVDFIAEQFVDQFGVDPRKDEGDLQRLMHEAEDVKRALTQRLEVHIHFAAGSHRFRTTLTRDEFETRTGDLLDRTQLTLEKVLREAGRTWKDVDRLLLVGGSSRMPMVQRMLESISGMPADRSLSPDEAVAHGAAIYAEWLLNDPDRGRREMSIRNVNSHDLGVLGIEKATGRSRRQIMIARNSPLPATRREVFPTYQDNQSSVVVHVVEGGDASGNQATSIGKCLVTGLPPNLPANTAVEVAFAYAENGRLTVSARVPSVGSEAILEVQRTSGLTTQKIDEWIPRVEQGVPDRPAETPEPVKKHEAASEPSGIQAPQHSASPSRRPEPEPRPAGPGKPSAVHPNSRNVTSTVDNPAMETPIAAERAAPTATDQQAAQKSKSQPIEARPARDQQNRDASSRSVAAAPLIEAEAKPPEWPAPESPSAQPVLKDNVVGPQTPASTSSVPTVATSSPAAKKTSTSKGAEQPKPKASEPAQPSTQESSPPRDDGGVSDDVLPVDIEEHELDPEEERLRARRKLIEKATAHAVNALLHGLVLLVLGMILLPTQRREEFTTISSAISNNEQPEELHVMDFSDELTPPMEEASVVTDVLALTEDRLDVDINDLDLAAAPPDVMLKTPGTNVKIQGEMGGRSEAGRAALVAREGGNSASEAAVTSGLKWLASVQREDGSWGFADVGPAGSPGNLTECYNGATAMALLCYLGAGQTHEKGDYQKTVERGLNYLISSMVVTPRGGDLRGKVTAHEGMYVHGLATIALCEAYALTKTRRIGQAATLAIAFVASAQDSKGGGWRYKPNEAGDTSVVGWQVMALQSARAAKIAVPGNAFVGATKFLDAVQVDGGSQYGYTGPAPGRPGTTAVGLICRMYMGWKKDNPGLTRGVDYLSKTGPSRENMYYNYYATQVLHHWGGEDWKKWNLVMRDQLVNTQIKDGPAGGSWSPSGGTGSVQGGRLYQTCLSVMTLEVYYRHLPLYQREAVEF